MSMKKLTEAIIRECALRMGIMIGDHELPPGLQENIELRIQQFVFEAVGGHRRDFTQLFDNDSNSLSHVRCLHEASVRGAARCPTWRPAATCYSGGHI